MDIPQETLDRIGQPESELLEYKAVLPPAATIAQLVCAFANTKGGAIVLGVVDEGDGILINGLSTSSAPYRSRARQSISSHQRQR
jgi:predicted HTH transcriptional regulator